MERPNTRWRTLFPSARWPTPWRSPRGDAATATASPVTGAGGLPGQPPRRTRRCPGHRLRLRSGIGRPLRPVRERTPDGSGAGRILHGAGPRSRYRRRWSSPTAPSRQDCSSWVCAGSRTTRTPSGSSPCAGTGAAYRLVVPPQTGTATRLAYQPARRGGRRVPLPRRLPRLLLGHRRPGRAGVPHLRRRRDASMIFEPELRLRVGVYGHFAPAGLAPGVLRTGSGPPADGRGARANGGS